VAYKIGKLIRVAPSFLSISASGLRVLMGLDLIPALLWLLALIYSSLKFMFDVVLSGLRRWIVGPEKPFNMPKFRYVSAKTIWVMLLLSSAAKAMYTCQDNASLGNPIMSYGSSGECDYNSTSGFASCGIDQNFKADIVGRAGGSYNFAINAKVSIDGSTIEAIDKRKLNINIGRVYYDVAVDPMYFALMHRIPFTGIGSQFNSYENRAGGGSHIDVATPDNSNKGVFCVVTDNDCDATVPLNECLVHDNRICCSLHALRDRLVYAAKTREEATSLGDISGFPWMRDIVMAPGPGVCSVASTNRQTVNCYKNTQVSTDPTSYARVFEIISGTPKIDLSVQTDDQCFNLTIPLNTADSRKISVYGGTIELSVRGPIPSFPYVGRRFGLFLDSTNPAMQPERNFFSGVAGGHRSGFISGKWADSAHGTQDNPGAYQFKRSLPSSSTDYSTYTAMTPTNQWAAGAGTWCHSCSASDSRCEFYDGLNDPITIIDSDEENWPDFNLQALEYGNFVAKRRDDTKSWVGELLTDWEFSLEMLKAPALTIDGVVKGINLTAVIDKNKKPCPMVSTPASTQNMTIGSSMTSSIKVTVRNSSPNCGSGFVSFEISSNGDVQGASTVCPVGPVDHECVLNFYPDENEGMIEYTLSYDGEVFKKDGLKFSARDAINPRNANAAQDSSDAADIIGGHRTPGHTSTGHSFGFALGKMVSFGNLFGTGLFGDLMGFGLWIILGLAVYFILTRASWPRMSWMSMKPKSVYELPVVRTESTGSGQQLRKRMPYSGRDF